MTALLTGNMPLLSESPNGIRKLRGLILELAACGKLVPQDPSDEPASELLIRMAEEKAQLVAVGKIKKQKSLPEITEEEKPYLLPTSWAWGRLGELTLKITDGTHHSPTNTHSGDYKYISAKNIKSWGIDETEITYVTKEVHQEIFSRCDPNKGDILYIKDGATTGIATINSLDEPFSMLSSVALLKPSMGLHNEYLLRAMTSPFFYREMRAGMTGVAITRITLAKLNNAIIPLPPLAEQHRIVAKVDELMALCDRLETQQADAESAHARLVQALLDSLTQASDAADFAASWQRLAEHFHTLFTTESSINALKQTLLQLAVMGKLLRQKADEGQAIDWLGRIKREKARLVEAGFLKKSKKNPGECSGEENSTIPSSWCWVTLTDITLGMDSGWSPACESNPSPNIDVWGVLKTTAVQVMQYLQEENKELPAHLEPRPDAEVRAGDILFTRAGPTNRVGISCLVESTRPRLMISDKIIRFHPVEAGAYGRYIALCLNTGNTANYLERAKSGMAASQVNISQEKLKLTPIPLAPLPEQHRIVAKVDQLMSLCDQLKTRLTQARQLNEQLASTLVEQAIA
ncbi:restriction endonuclease subunit S [Pseudomonas akapageensis]|uniref:restriction endonuclease subunit S n=1 Tax=Pseudomonas akapageensis TaxID=2609961 RepID=UPI00140C9C97|nr:restriction endonuclease subunit S [Pseudomonas akapageensis]